ncbi:MAG: SUMF1/EgtB/PvdO family nonheme iron enzyme, partial [Verrucomicrobia bacterium]|nr:SUMF1/EgtB/PvdO family nonheme iron enzyme [Verrucomicrobiota bacterium]
MTGLTGQTIAGCEIISELGHGGMGAVYKARQSSLNRLVAVKVMSAQLADDADYITRFKREAAVAAQLHHQNMVLVHSAGEENGLCYIVMEFVEGRSLHDHIERHGRLAAREALAITIHIAQALQYAWNKSKLIHRDIKPANIFLSNEGEVKVGDLGLAKSVGQSTAGLTQTGTAMGSPLYIAPEQARGIKEIDFRADIYSLGCTLYHMLTGQPPYSGTDAVSIIHKHIFDPPPAIFKALPGCPMPLGMLVGKMLAKQPNARHQSYEDLIADLYAVTEKIEAASVQATAALPQPAADVAATVPPATPAKTPSQPQPRTATPKPAKSRVESRMPRAGVAAGVVALAVLIGGLLLWSPWKQSGTGVSPVLSSLDGQAGRLSYSAALKQLGNVFTNSVGAEMVYIPPGEFLLGSTKEEQAWALANKVKEEEVKREGEAPRKATIKPGFWMGRTEVTVSQWKDFVAATGYKTDAEKKGYVDYSPQKGQALSRVDGLSWRDPGFGAVPQNNHPVCCISWNDAVAFCEWLTERERKAERIPASHVVRLPTEAEWEYACRAGMQTRFWWGEDKEDGKGRLNRSGEGDGFEFVAPVDSFGERGRNKFGLADMLGNIGEWCLDGYDAKEAHEECYMGNPSAAVLRGGGFWSDVSGCRCATRTSNRRSSAGSTRGFRVCVGADVTSSAGSTPSTSPAAGMQEGGILARAETRVSALTTTPKVGEVFTLPLGSNVTMELMGIPPGEFMLGSTKEEQAWAVANGGQAERVKCEGAAPRKTVIEQGCWMGRTEVTVGQWKQFVKETGYVTDGEKNGESYVFQGPGKLNVGMKGKSWRDPNFGFEPRDDHPVCCVSWNDAKAFCKWLEGREQQAGRLPHGFAVRLPTEAEWEYACRAGQQTKFWWGDASVDGRGRLNWVGKDDGFEFTAPVDSFGTRGRNGFGLADMLGNVWEWCLDEYDAAQAHEELWTGKPGRRVARGGSLIGGGSDVRCATRANSAPTYSSSGLGFRVCVGVDVAGSAGSAAQSRTGVSPVSSSLDGQAGRLSYSAALKQ